MKRLLTLAAVLASSLALPAVAGTAPVEKSEADKPNVLVIVADDLGYSDIGAFGGEIPTPNLDELAQQGRRLSSHYVAPTCSPTRAMLLTGTDNHLVGLGQMGEFVDKIPPQSGQPGYEGHLNDKAVVLPEVLRDAGYGTYMVGKWHLGTAPENWPIAKGFDESFALLQGGGSHFSPVEGKRINADNVTYVEGDQEVELPSDFYSSNTFTQKMIDYIERNKDNRAPFFGYLAYTAPHWPLHAPDEDIALFEGKYDEGYEAIRTARIERMKAMGLLAEDASAAERMPASEDFPSWQQLTPEQRKVEARKMEVYAAMVHNMDRNIGKLLTYLKDNGLYENTLVIFQSDNGADPSPSGFFAENQHTDNSLEVIGRPLSSIGAGPRWAEVSSTPFRLFKGYMADGGIVAPAIVRLPGQEQGLPDLNKATHVSDVAPTILNLANIEQPRGEYKGREVHEMTGQNISQQLAAAEPVASDRLISGEMFGGRYVRDGRWKLVSIVTPFGDNEWELYDLAADPGERNNLAGQHPQQVERLSARWNEYAQNTGVVFVPMKRMPDVSFDAKPMGTPTDK